MSATFVPAPGFDEELNQLAGMRQELLSAAEDIAAEAQSASPEHTGHYRESVEAVIDGTHVRVRTTDPVGHLIEYGSVNNPPYSPIRQGVARAGYRLAEDSK